MPAYYATVQLRVKDALYDSIKTYAERDNLSVPQFILQCITTIVEYRTKEDQKNQKGETNV